MKSSRRAALALVVALGTGHCAVEREDAVLSSSRARITGGAPETRNQSIVLVVVGVAAKQQVTGLCTGTVVAPHVVLTAAHCLDARVVGKDQSFAVFLGDDLHDDGQFGDRKNWRFDTTRHVHPDFDPALAHGNDPGRDDIAVLVTDEEIPRAPVPMQRVPIDDAVVGRDAMIVGFGIRDPTDGESDGRRMSTMLPIRGIDDVHLWTTAQLRGTCRGDSGGPLLLDQDGTLVVAGVHSYGEHRESCAGTAWATRVDAYLDFLDSQIAIADPDFVPARAPEHDAAPVDTAPVDAAGSPLAARPPAQGGCSVQ